MADTATPKPAKKAAAKTKKPRTTPEHPPIFDMIKAAISSLKERNGSSRQAIVKYISANYKVNVEKITPHIKKGLRSAVTKGALVHTKGTGASGSFKLAAAAKAEKKTAPKKKPAAKKPAAKKATPKKTTKAKPKTAKKPAVKKAAKSPAKKAAAKKSPAKKPAAKKPKAKSPAKKKAPAKK